MYVEMVPLCVSGLSAVNLYVCWDCDCALQLKDKDDEIEELRANVEELRSLLENETLCKVDYQNNLQSLNEELSFRKKVYEEVRTNHAVSYWGM